MSKPAKFRCFMLMQQGLLRMGYAIGLVAGFAMGLATELAAQPEQVIRQSAVIQAPSSGGQTIISINASQLSLPEKFRVKVTLRYGRNLATNPQEIPPGLALTVPCTLTAGAEATAQAQHCDLTINASSPVQAKVLYFSTALLGTGISNLKIAVGSITGSTSPLCTLETEVEVPYGVATLPVVSALYHETFAGKKYVNLSWDLASETEPARRPNWEIQVMKLENKTGNPTLTNEITTPVNWNEALTIVTEKPDLAYRMTLSKGSGFYAWRVRPTGKDLNGNTVTGDWSPSLNWSSAYTLSDAVTTPWYFWYNDPDDHRNTIYTRNFSEGGKVKEVIQYANGLQQSKQTQTFLPSLQKILAAPTLYDFAGRNNAIQVLPTPLAPANQNEGLNGYIPQLAEPGSAPGRMYNGTDFEGKALKQTPSLKLKDNYYSSTNPEGGIPDDEGKPFARTRFYDEALGRVASQSGMGQKLLENPTTTTYSSAGNEELKRLFGSDAPDANQVYKTYQTDPNGVTTATYQLKGGKVLATAVVGQPSGSTTMEALPSDDVSAMETVLETEKSVLEDGILKSKALVNLVDKTSNLTINYQLTPPEAMEVGCFDIGFNNQYELKIIVTKLDGDGGLTSLQTPPSDWTMELVSQNCLAFKCSVDVAVGSGPTVSPIVLTELGTGRYRVEKQLKWLKYKGAEANEGEIVEGQYKIITEYINVWLEDAKCRNDFMELFNLKIKRMVDKYMQLRECTTGCGVKEQELYSFLSGELHGDKPPLSIPDDNCFKGWEWDASHTPPACTHIDDKNLFNVDGMNVGLVPACTTSTASSSTGLVACTTSTEAITQIVLATECCGTLKLPIDNRAVFPRYALLKPDNNVLKVNPFMTSANPDDRAKTCFFPDFEGYAYSYFKDCINPYDYPAWILAHQNNVIDSWYNSGGDLEFISQGSSSFTSDQKIRIAFVYDYILKSHMQGYLKAGTFNLMVYKMLTDRYICDGYRNNLNPDGSLVTTKPFIRTDFSLVEYPTDPCSDPDYLDDPINNPLPLPVGALRLPHKEIESCTTKVPYNGQDFQLDDDRRKGNQYSLEQLATCWMNLLAKLKQDMKINCEGESIDFPDNNSEGTASEEFSDPDKEPQGGAGNHDHQIDDNIDLGWFMNWWNKNKIRKLSEQVRNAQGDGADVEALNTGGLAAAKHLHLVKAFLGCTGTRFAAILEPVDNEETAVKGVLSEDRSGSAAEVAWNTSTPPVTFDGHERDFVPMKAWRAYFCYKPPPGANTCDDNDANSTGKVNLFPNIPDPVYAFKYFYYVPGTRQDLEQSTCFYDPNYRCGTNHDQPCCVDGSNAVPCNFCGKGKIICPGDYRGWTCGQRMTFYTMLRDIPKNPIDNVYVLPKGIQEKDYLSAGVIHSAYPEGTTPIQFDCNGLFLKDAAGVTFAFGDNAPVFYTWEAFATGDPKEIYKSLKNYDQYFASDRTTPVFQVLENNVHRNLRTKVELDVMAMHARVEEACSKSIPVIQKEIIAALSKVGYTFEECTYGNCDNVVTKENLAHLVEKVYDECLERGRVNNFKIETKTCRYAGEPDIKEDNTPNQGENSNEVITTYGVVEHPAEPGSGCTTAVFHYRPVDTRGAVIDNCTIPLSSHLPADVSSAFNFSSVPTLFAEDVNTGALSVDNTRNLYYTWPPKATPDATNQNTLYDCSNATVPLDYLQLKRHSEVVTTQVKISAKKNDLSFEPDPTVVCEHCEEVTNGVCKVCKEKEESLGSVPRFLPGATVVTVPGENGGQVRPDSDESTSLRIKINPGATYPEPKVTSQSKINDLRQP